MSEEEQKQNELPVTEGTEPQNGIAISADMPNQSVGLALVINGQKIGMQLTIKEADNIKEALSAAICKAMGDPTGGGRCNPDCCQQES